MLHSRGKNIEAAASQTLLFKAPGFWLTLRLAELSWGSLQNLSLMREGAPARLQDKTVSRFFVYVAGVRRSGGPESEAL